MKSTYITMTQKCSTMLNILHFLHLRNPRSLWRAYTKTQKMLHNPSFPPLSRWAPCHGLEKLGHQVWIRFELVHLVDKLFTVLHHKLHCSLLQLSSTVQVCQHQTFQAGVHGERVAEHLL